jgi:hypothetical protein
MNMHAHRTHQVGKQPAQRYIELALEIAPLLH